MVVASSGPYRHKKILVYHERQGANRRCGQHVVNNLLQRDRFGESDLKAVSKRLDSREASAMGFNPEKLKESGNSSSDGYYNLSVLELSLLEAGVVIVPLGKLGGEAKFNPSSSGAEGYLVNQSDHWLGYRKIKGKWFALDSLKEAPEVVESSELNSLVRQSAKRTSFGLFPQDGTSLPLVDDWAADPVRDIKRLRERTAGATVHDLGEGSIQPPPLKRKALAAAVKVIDCVTVKDPLTIALSGGASRERVQLDKGWNMYVFVERVAAHLGVRCEEAAFSIANPESELTWAPGKGLRLGPEGADLSQELIGEHLRNMTAYRAFTRNAI